MDADNHVVLSSEMIFLNVEGVQGKVAIVSAVPSPVDVIGVVTGIIAVDVKGVSKVSHPFAVPRTVYDGTSVGKFVLQQGIPMENGSNRSSSWMNCPNVK